MHSWAVWAAGFFSSATMRHTMSRSVTTPINLLATSMIGISPQLLSTIIFATVSRDVVAEQHAGSGVITSRAYLAMCSSWSETPRRVFKPAGLFPIDRPSIVTVQPVFVVSRQLDRRVVLG